MAKCDLSKVRSLFRNFFVCLFFIIKFVFLRFSFLLFFDEVSNFRKRILTSQKHELVVSSCY